MEREERRTRDLANGYEYTPRILAASIKELEARMAAIAAENERRHDKVTEITARLPSNIDAYAIFGFTSEV